MTKRMTDLAGRMLLRELYGLEVYENRPNVPWDLWLQQRLSPMKPKD
jgi:hypothetical protein